MIEKVPGSSGERPSLDKRVDLKNGSDTNGSHEQDTAYLNIHCVSSFRF